MKKAILILAILVTTLTILSGCTGVNPTPQTQSNAGALTFKDALDRDVSLAKSPEHIVLAGKATTFMADLIYMFPDASKRIVALDSRKQSSKDFIPLIDPSYADKALIQTDSGPEQIAPLKPDLVLLKMYMAEKLGNSIEKLQIPVAYLDFESPEKFSKDVTMLGKLFGNEKRAQEVLAYYDGKQTAISNTLANLKEGDKPSVLMLYYSDQGGTTAFNIAPASWQQTIMVQMGGGKPIWTEASDSGGWKVVNFEQIAAWNPDQIYIIVYKGNSKDVVDKLKTDSQWQALNAVKDGKLYGFAADFYSWDQPDTRWILGYSWLAAKIHPDLFKDYDVQKDVTTFYQTIYGMNETDSKTLVIPELKGDVK